MGSHQPRWFQCYCDGKILLTQQNKYDATPIYEMTCILVHTTWDWHNLEYLVQL